MHTIDISHLEYIHGGADSEYTARGCKAGAIIFGTVLTPTGGYIGNRVTRGFKGKVIGTGVGLVYGAAVGLLGGCAIGAGAVNMKHEP